jgi:hypothetical protein
VHRSAHGKGRLDSFNERPFHELLFGEHTGRLYLHWRASCSGMSPLKRHNHTYAQKTVEVDAARVECAVEVIHRVLNRAVFGDEVYESV